MVLCGSRWTRGSSASEEAIWEVAAHLQSCCPGYWHALHQYFVCADTSWSFVCTGGEGDVPQRKPSKRGSKRPELCDHGMHFASTLFVVIDHGALSAQVAKGICHRGGNLRGAATGDVGARTGVAMGMLMRQPQASPQLKALLQVRSATCCAPISSLKNLIPPFPLRWKMSWIFSSFLNVFLTSCGIIYLDHLYDF